MSYNQLVDHLEAAATEGNEISDDLLMFRALIGHQGLVKPIYPNQNRCIYNVLVDCETGEKTYKPLSVMATHDAVTCAIYEKRLFHTSMAEKGSEILQKEIKP